MYYQQNTHFAKFASYCSSVTTGLHTMVPLANGSKETSDVQGEPKSSPYNAVIFQ